MNVKGIGFKLAAIISGLVATIAIGLGTISYISSSNAIEEQVQQRVEAKAADVTHYVEEVFQRLFVEVESLANQQALQAIDFDNLQQEFQYLEQEIKQRPDYLAFAIVDAKGTAHYTDGTTAELGDRSYIQAALKGETVLSEIVISRVTGEPVNMMATPIKTNTGDEALLLARIDGYVLSEVVESVKLGETGYAFMINDSGTIQAHVQRDFVKSELNVVEHAASTGEMTGEAKAAETMMANEQGFTTYKNDAGDEMLTGYATLNNGWSLAVAVERDEMMQAVDSMKNQVILVSVLFLIAGIILSVLVGRSLSRPIFELVKVSEKLAKGDFTQTISEKNHNRHDELGLLSRSMEETISSMRTMIQKVENNAIEVEQASETLLVDVTNVSSHTAVITNLIEEVEAGSVMQAQMASEGAKAMEQTAIGIQQAVEVAASVKNYTETIETQVQSSSDAVLASIQQMEQIKHGTQVELDVISKLANESAEISHISKIITDISDQTNLLALNASIEAARAGEAGKGFAVVADEVRKLASETAQSAAQINGLIASVQLYTTQVVEAAKSSEANVVKGMETIESLHNRFQQIVASVDQIAEEIAILSTAAQEMSASSQEITASVEEISATADTAKEHVAEVNISVHTQLETVQQMDQKARQLEDMATQLRAAVDAFKL